MLKSLLLLGIIFPYIPEATHWLSGGGRQECSQTICTCDGTINGIEVLLKDPSPQDTSSKSSYNTSHHAEQCKTYSLGDCTFSDLDDKLTRIHLVTNNITDIINVGVENIGYAPQVEIVGSPRGLKYYNTIEGDLVGTTEHIQPGILTGLDINLCPSSHKLSHDTFTLFTSLITLRLSSSNLPIHVDLESAGFLANQRQLQGLHIDHVKINKIHTGDFCHLSMLDEVAITSAGSSVIHGFQCEDTACNGPCLDRLEELQLRRNNISDVSITFVKVMPEVEKIDLSENGVLSINENIFSNLRRLQRLNLMKNNIKHISLKSFENLPKLSELDLSFNDLHTLNMEVFQIIDDLKVLNLSYNYLHEIDNSKIPDNLEHLFLQNNPLMLLGDSTFLTRRKSLTNLDLSNTELRHLQIRNISQCDISEICKTDTMMDVNLNGNR